MPEELIQSLADWLTRAIGHELGSDSFYVVLGVTLAAWIIVARLFAGLFGSDKGIVLGAIAVIAPLAWGIIAYGLIEVYALPNLEMDWAPTYLPWSGFGLMVVLGILAVSRPALSVGLPLTLATLLIATGAAAGAYYGSQVFVDFMSQGEEKVEERNEALNESLESIPAR